MIHVNDMVELIVRAAVAGEEDREMKARKTVKLSPSQAVMMAKIETESRNPEIVDGWISIDDIVKAENHRTFVALIRKGYLAVSELFRDGDGVHHRYTKIPKGP